MVQLAERSGPGDFLYGDIVTGPTTTDADRSAMRPLDDQPGRHHWPAVAIASERVNDRHDVHHVDECQRSRLSSATLVLPPVVACQGVTLTIKNRGSGTVTVNADSGTDIMPSNASPTAVNTFNLSSGYNAILISDGVDWNRQSKHLRQLRSPSAADYAMAASTAQ